MSQIRVLLVDDQEIVFKTLEALLEGESDIALDYCQDPTEALDKASSFKPTVILQDLLMPQMDGLTLVRYYRANEETKEVPLVVLSSKEDPKVKAEAFSLGASDYLVKLPDKEELIARIRHHSKGYTNQLERNEAYSKLEKSEAILRGELSEAARYVRSLLPAPIEGEISTKWHFLPSMDLGGDAFGYHWIDEDTFSLYLLDVCGHGVGAAMLSISVANVIGSGKVPSDVVASPKKMLSYLNESFPMDHHNGMFFTLWYGIYNRKTRIMTYASGGHPPALLLYDGECERLSSRGVLVGGIEGQQFDEKETTVKKGAKLLLFSDGVFEILRPDGTRMDFDEYVDLVMDCQKDEPIIDSVLEKVKKEQGNSEFVDDFSLMEVVFD